MCRNTINCGAQHFAKRLRPKRKVAEAHCSGIPIRPRGRAVTGFLSLVTTRTAAKLKPAHHIRME
jgi:hypothetical protein